MNDAQYPLLSGALIPSSNFSFQAYLTEFLQSLSQQPFYELFKAHHSDAEKQVLRTVNIAV